MIPATRRISRRQQNGFVLVACLIILLVLTVLGVSSMNTATLQQRMAANSQNKYGTFQIAESAIDDTFKAGTDINTVISNGTPVTTTYDYGSDYTTATTTRPQPTDPRYLTGFSLNIFSGATVEINGSAASSGTGAKSQLALGVTKVIPKQ